ncbi:uncharacterized protein LOC142317451 [Lycorma delicatula]|uniref:uncharacterized protein LOC142317451 n=1 Tax=Lycorma delicatula TaxID=130591 RepID=UPI003F518297
MKLLQWVTFLNIIKIQITSINNILLQMTSNEENNIDKLYDVITSYRKVHSSSKKLSNIFNIDVLCYVVLLFWLCVEIVYEKSESYLTNYMISLIIKCSFNWNLLFLIILHCTSVTKELQCFICELKHCPIDFPVYDLFTVNNSLVPSVIGTIITYIIIFEQYDTEQH